MGIEDDLPAFVTSIEGTLKEVLDDFTSYAKYRTEQHKQLTARTEALETKIESVTEAIESLKDKLPEKFISRFENLEKSVSGSSDIQN